MFCMKCGKELPDGAEFCAFCGTKIGGMREGVVEAPAEKYYTVVIKREKKTFGMAQVYDLFIDGELVSQLKNGGSFTIELPAGQHNFVIEGNIGARMGMTVTAPPRAVYSQNIQGDTTLLISHKISGLAFGPA